MVLELNPQAPQCQLALVFVLAPEALVLMMLLSKKQVLLVPEEALVQVLPSVQLVIAVEEGWVVAEECSNGRRVPSSNYCLERRVAQDKVHVAALRKANAKSE